MVEKRCLLIPEGDRLLARLLTRAFGRAEWIVAEEYDVTDQLVAITKAHDLLQTAGKEE